MIEQNAGKYRVKTKARDFTNLLAKSGRRELVIEQNACKYRVKTTARDFTHLLAKSGGSEL